MRLDNYICVLVFFSSLTNPSNPPPLRDGRAVQESPNPLLGGGGSDPPPTRQYGPDDHFGFWVDRT